MLRLALASCALGFSLSAAAQAFPQPGKPVRIVVPFPPGGHTLLYTIATHVQIPHLYKVPPWDVSKDFTPITPGARSATVLTVSASAGSPESSWCTSPTRAAATR